MVADRDRRLREGRADELEKIREDLEKKVERWKSEIIENSGIEQHDMAFARRTLGKIERDELLGKCLDTHLNGTPLTDRIKQEFQTEVFKKGFN